MTFIVDTPTLRVMMNGFDSMVKPTIDVQQTAEMNIAVCCILISVYKCKGEAWNIIMSSNRYSHVSCATRYIIRCVMCLAQYARLAYYSDILLMSVSDYSYCIHVHVH